MLDGNKIRYSWKFRIQNASLLEPVEVPGAGVSGTWATTSLAKSAVLGQFHTNANYRDLSTNEVRSCGSNFNNTSPSPGLEARVEGDHFVVTLYVKLKAREIPPYLESFKSGCAVQEDNNSNQKEMICVVPLLTKNIPKNEVLGKWFSLEYDIKLSQVNTGSLEFSFGRKDLPRQNPLSFQKQKFIGGTRDIIDAIATMPNECPSLPRLGIYALTFNPLYYADIENGQSGPQTSKAFVDAKTVRQSQPRNWASEAFQATFLRNKSNPLESTPRLVVDYDDFSITQLGAGPTSGVFSSINLANVLSAVERFIGAISDFFK